MSLDNHSIPVVVGVRVPENSPSLNAEKYSESWGCHTPLVDIHERPEGLILEAEVPGATEDNVRIQLQENVLVLHVKVTQALPESARLLHQEYQVADYFRSFILSDEVERSKITAELRNGVLRLILPKAERVKTRRIEINS